MKNLTRAAIAAAGIAAATLVDPLILIGNGSWVG